MTFEKYDNMLDMIPCLEVSGIYYRSGVGSQTSFGSRALEGYMDKRHELNKIFLYYLMVSSMRPPTIR
jgi:hypothetical protein